MRETNRSLFDLLLDDLLLDETYPWKSLNEAHTNLAIQILARLIVQAARGSEEKGKKNDE